MGRFAQKGLCYSFEILQGLLSNKNIRIPMKKKNSGTPPSPPPQKSQFWADKSQNGPFLPEGFLLKDTNLPPFQIVVILRNTRCIGNSLIKLIYDNATLEDENDDPAVSVTTDNDITGNHIDNAWSAVLGATVHVLHRLTM